MAKRQRVKAIIFPVGGVNRAAGFQQQPPYTCADASNVWPRDIELGRSRGGSRPGLATYGGSLGSDPQFLGRMNVRTGSGTGYAETLVGIAGGTLKKSTAGGSWETVGATTITAGQGWATPALGKLWIPAPTPKVWDPAGTIGNWTASDGTFPSGCTIATSWADRVVLAGNPAAPNELYFAKQGDPTNFAYGEDNSRSALLGSAYYGGQVGEPVTSLIPIHRQCLLIGCPNQLWVLRGNPTERSGRLDPLSFNVGVLSQHAWSHTYDGGAAFLSKAGLYYMPYGCGQAPIPLSEEAIPDELIGISTSTNKIAMAFDRTMMALMIFITPNSGSGQHYWMDWRNRGFWPMTYPATMQPTAACNFPLAGTDKNHGTAILGCKDGTTRQADRQTDDAGEVINSLIDIGPFRLSGTIDELAQVQSYRVALGADSGTVISTFAVGKTAEEAAEKTTSEAATLADPSVRNFPRLRGHAGVLSLASAAAWSFEEASIAITDSGRMR